MKLIGGALVLAALCSVALDGQEIKTTTKEKTKVEIKDGKDVKVVGCLARTIDGAYVLTNDVGDFKYTLITDENLSRRVGQRIEVKGIATDRGDAKVKIESKVGTTGEVGGQKADETKATTTRKLEGDLNLRYIGLRSIKKISDSCR